MKQIELHLDSRAVKPGEQISGTAKWFIDEDEPEVLNINLFWYTEGAGTQDAEVVASQVIEHAGIKGEKKFAFNTPQSPYSCRGKHISILWAVEVVTADGKTFSRENIVVAPHLTEVVLTEIPITKMAKWKIENVR